MSVYKEGYYAVSGIKGQSRRVYPDAADFGVPVNLGDDNCKMVNTAIHFYGDKESRKVDRYETGVTVEQTIELMDEWSTGRIERFKFTYVSQRRTKQYPFDGYIYVEEVK